MRELKDVFLLTLSKVLRLASFDVPNYKAFCLLSAHNRRKAKPRLRKKCSQCSSCRSADSCVNLNKSYLSMYHNLFFLCEKQVHSEQVFI